MSQSHQRMIAGWLFVCCAMIFVMVVLGGVTRLTHSGLSMVEWRPLSGWLPPFAEADWRALFDSYREFPEFRLNNPDMTVDGFKSIFWLEFLHRLWGRLIGLVFFVPMVFFLARRWVDRALAWRLAVVFALGGAQGGLGWFMVKSGLVDDPDVSAYRLAAHLGLALALYGYILALALRLWRAEFGGVVIGEGLQKRFAGVTVAMAFITTLSGAFVAGLDAGLTYNTFPLMDGQWVPDGLFGADPWYLSLFEDVMTVQFDHRVFAVSTALTILAIRIFGVPKWPDGGIRRSVNALCVMIVIQVGLGITTLLLVVPVHLAALHQAGAVMVLTLAIWFWHESSRDI